MTEAEWLASNDPAAMIRCLGQHKMLPVSPRKLLAWTGACQSKANPSIIWNNGGPAELAAYWAYCNEWDATCPLAYRAAILRDIIGNPCEPIALPKSRMISPGLGKGDPDRVSTEYCRWLTPTVLSLAQAAYEPRYYSIIDGTLDNARLAILSDALEEAGCPPELPCLFCGGKRIVQVKGLLPLKCNCVDIEAHPILAHLRSPGSHVRGCWVLDLILGKE